MICWTKIKTNEYGCRKRIRNPVSDSKPIPITGDHVGFITGRRTRRCRSLERPENFNTFKVCTFVYGPKQRLVYRVYYPVYSMRIKRRFELLSNHCSGSGPEPCTGPR